ncbi:MAG: GIY-YIG nuclease family protein [Metallibacterium scheffleri]
MSKGFVYALSNPAFPKLLKIGFSSKVPSDRADELYTTGVPSPYSLSYYCLVDDAKDIEGRIHSMLSSYRHNSGREFFQIDVQSLKRLISSLAQPDHEYEDRELTNTSPDHKITLISRHGIELEEQEMVNFAIKAKEAGLATFVQKLFYDSNSCCCVFEFSGNFYESDYIIRELLLIASETISQFEWFDSIRHGSFVPDLDDPSEL